MKTATLWIAAALIGAGSPAFAQSISLRDVLGREDDGRRAAAPQVARYISGDGAEFVLDRSRATPLLKFGASEEIWILTASAAPRGDVIYRNDAGDSMLRATKLGGLTLFTESRPGGAPAALAGATEVLRPPVTATAGSLLQRLTQATVRASRAAKRSIPFEASGEGPANFSIYADAATVASEGIVRMSTAANAPTLLGRIRRVRLESGSRPSVTVRGGVMVIILTPRLGVAGRPSSARIVKATASGR